MVMVWCVFEVILLSGERRWSRSGLGRRKQLDKSSTTEPVRCGKKGRERAGSESVWGGGFFVPCRSARCGRWTGLGSGGPGGTVSSKRDESWPLGCPLLVPVRPALTAHAQVVAGVAGREGGWELIDGFD